MKVGDLRQANLPLIFSYFRVTDDLYSVPLASLPRTAPGNNYINNDRGSHTLMTYDQERRSYVLYTTQRLNGKRINIRKPRTTWSAGNYPDITPMASYHKRVLCNRSSGCCTERGPVLYGVSQPRTHKAERAKLCRNFSACTRVYR